MLKKSEAFRWVEEGERRVNDARFALDAALDELREAYTIWSQLECDHGINWSHTRSQVAGGKWTCDDCGRDFTPAEALYEEWDAHRVYNADLQDQHYAGLLDERWARIWVEKRNAAR